MTICDVRALAVSVVNKCSVQVPENLYDGRRQQPQYNIPVFGGKIPLTQPIAWHGIDNYNFLLPVADDPVTITDIWDGCTYTPSIEGRHGPNVNGLGFVDQVTTIRYLLSFVC
jgi:hypothetical protein